MNKQPKYIVVNYMEPLPTPGSKIWRAHQIAQSLNNAGRSVEYITSSFDHFNKSYRSHPSSESTPYPLTLLFATPYKSNKSILRLLSNLTFAIALFLHSWRFRYRPSVWILSYPHSQQILSLCLAKIINPNISIIVDLRDSPFLPGNSFMVSIYNALERFQVGVWISCVDKLLGAGPSILNYFKLENASKAQSMYHYIPMACADINRDYTALPTETINVSLSSSPSLIFFGTLTNSFDLLASVTISKQIEELTFQIAGSGPLFDQLDQLSAGIPSITMHGHVNFNQIVLLAKSSQYSLLCYSQLEYTRFNSHFTNKFSESLQLGLTILIPSWCSVMADFVITHKCGYVYESINELKTILCSAHSNYPPLNKSHLFMLYTKYFSTTIFQSSILKVISPS
jgi:hypothetical protein